MRNALHHRLDPTSEEGFTLIELMVVVLIIGILLAIAIPTFLGARDRANDRSAQSNLRNALTAEKTIYTDNETYVDTNSGTGPTQMAQVEPSLSWIGTSGAYVNRAVSATVVGSAPSTSIVLTDQSATGTCWYIADIPGPTTGGAGTLQAGTYYAQDAGNSSTHSCPVVGAPGPGAVTASSSSTTPGTWALAF